MSAIDDLSSGPFYHGTKADLKKGDLIELKAMKDHLEQLKRLGIEAIED